MARNPARPQGGMSKGNARLSHLSCAAPRLAIRRLISYFVISLAFMMNLLAVVTLEGALEPYTSERFENREAIDNVDLKLLTGIMGVFP